MQNLIAIIGYSSDKVLQVCIVMLFKEYFVFLQAKSSNVSWREA